VWSNQWSQCDSWLAITLSSARVSTWHTVPVHGVLLLEVIVNHYFVICFSSDNCPLQCYWYYSKFAACVCVLQQLPFARGSWKVCARYMRTCEWRAVRGTRTVCSSTRPVTTSNTHSSMGQCSNHCCYVCLGFFYCAVAVGQFVIALIVASVTVRMVPEAFCFGAVCVCDCTSVIIYFRSVFWTACWNFTYYISSMQS